MTTRGVVILSTLFGLFALAMGLFAARAIDLGPDGPRPSAQAIARRAAAADRLELRIARLRANVPPALPVAPVVPVAAQSFAQAPRVIATAAVGSGGHEGHDREHAEGGERDDA